MLFDDLLEASIVELGVLGQVVNICNDIAQILLEQFEVLLQIVVGLCRCILLVLPVQHLLNLLVASFYPAHNLLALELLESEDLVELALELLDEGGLVVVGPLTPLAILAVRVWCLQGVLQPIVVYVVPVIVLDQRLSKLLAKPASMSASDPMLLRGSRGHTSCCTAVRGHRYIGKEVRAIEVGASEVLRHHSKSIT